MDGYYKYKISNIPVVYEDAWLLILDKPKGLLTQPTPKKEVATLTHILNEDLKHRGITYRLHPCHRLDRETSGLIIYAKGKSIQKKMLEEFKQKKVKKTYLAFVRGSLSDTRGKINIPLEGKETITYYRVIQRRKYFSVVEVRPLTGRTNQIRIHFKQIGHPIMGETKYTFRKDFKLRARRLCLHAKTLKFMHPLTKETISLTTQVPSDMRDFLEKH